MLNHYLFNKVQSPQRFSLLNHDRNKLQPAIIEQGFLSIGIIHAYLLCL
jgi:hypothetical protein